MISPDELKKKMEHTQKWKELAPDVKENLRSSWKILDYECKKHDGRPRFIESIVSDMSVKGCVFGDTGHVDDRYFIEMVKSVEEQAEKRQTKYAVHSYAGRNEFIYETDGEWHHIKLKNKEDYEEDTLELTLEKHHRTEYTGDFISSHIETYIKRLYRMYKTRNEHAVQEMLELSKEVNQKIDQTLNDIKEPLNENIIWQISRSRRLADRVTSYFE